MDPLTYEVNKLAKKIRRGSISARADRARMMRFFSRAVAKEFHRLELQNLGGKHIDWFVAKYRAGHLSPGGAAPEAATVKNMLSALRTLLHRIGKENLLPKDNAALGIAQRCYVPTTSRASRVSDEIIAQLDVRSPWTGASVRLMRAFGLRLEESMKVVPVLAYYKTELRMHGSWCKNGKPRAVPIRTREQLEAIHHALQVAGDGSLTAPGIDYIAARRALINTCNELGLSARHGLRHAYAQDQYTALARMSCPLSGGPLRGEMTPEQVARDLNVRIQIAQELGHERPSISKTYLGAAAPRALVMKPLELVPLTELLG